MKQHKMAITILAVNLLIIATYAVLVWIYIVPN